MYCHSLRSQKADDWRVRRGSERWDGGEKAHLNNRDQLLLTVVWLRQYPTHDVLGYFFGVSQPTVGRYIERILPLLEQTGRDSMKGHDPGRKRRAAALLEDVRGDRRSLTEGWQQRDATVKSQIVVESERADRDVADSVKGRVSDIKLVEQSGVLSQLPDLTG